MTKTSASNFMVLYADDDADDLDLVYEALQQHANHFSLKMARDGQEAVSYLQQLQPHELAPCLIILDINMPRMNGKEALKRIRSMERFKETPVVLFTTSSNPDDRAFARQYEAGFITKPINSPQLSAIAEQLLAHCGQDARQGAQRSFS